MLLTGIKIKTAPAINKTRKHGFQFWIEKKIKLGGIFQQMENSSYADGCTKFSFKRSNLKDGKNPYLLHI